MQSASGEYVPNGLTILAGSVERVLQVREKMVDTLKAIKRLACERDNLVKLLDCCERRERRYKELVVLVRELGGPHPGYPYYCWCQMRIGNPMVREHSWICKQLFEAIFRRDRNEKDASGEGQCFDTSKSGGDAEHTD